MLPSHPVLADSGTCEVLVLTGVFTHAGPLVWNSLPPDCVWLVLPKPQYPSPRRPFLSILSQVAHPELSIVIPQVLPEVTQAYPNASGLYLYWNKYHPKPNAESMFQTNLKSKAVPSIRE